LRSTVPSRLGGWLTPATSPRWNGAGKGKAVPGRPVESDDDGSQSGSADEIFLRFVVEEYLQNKNTMKRGQTNTYLGEDQSMK